MTAAPVLDLDAPLAQRVGDLLGRELLLAQEDPLPPSTIVTREPSELQACAISTPTPPPRIDSDPAPP